MDKLATMQQEILHISQVQQNMFNALQTLVTVKKRELPECIELPVKTLLELETLEKKSRKQGFSSSCCKILFSNFI